MSDPTNESYEMESEMKLQQILQADRRYPQDAYLFVSTAIHHTQRKYGKKGHVTGQELCMGIKDFAIEKFGMMAKVVLNDWGILKTDDIGEIVFNLVENELMKTTEQDKREDFKGVYDLDEAFVRDFKFEGPLPLD